MTFQCCYECRSKLLYALVVNVHRLEGDNDMHFIYPLIWMQRLKVRIPFQTGTNISANTFHCIYDLIHDSEVACNHCLIFRVTWFALNNHMTHANVVSVLSSCAFDNWLHYKGWVITVQWVMHQSWALCRVQYGTSAALSPCEDVLHFLLLIYSTLSYIHLLATLSYIQVFLATSLEQQISELQFQATV